MSTTGIQFVGLTEAYAAMEVWAIELAPALEAAGESFGEGLADEVSALVPVLTGRLADSVDAETEPGGVAVSIGEGVPYAGWIEFGGTRGREWVPEGRYLYPTARAAGPEWERLVVATSIETVGSFPWPIAAL